MLSTRVMLNEECLWTSVLPQWQVSLKSELHVPFKIFIVIMDWQTQTADASVCSRILGWKGSSIFPLWEGEIQLKDLEKSLSGWTVSALVANAASPASCCFPGGSVDICVCVRARVCRFARDCEVRGRVIKNQSFKFPRPQNCKEKWNNVFYIHGKECTCPFSAKLCSSDWID